ncbi:hypothetical protein FQA39_LY13262 [Lamprigera yunnana]|nr:hypothetical protein FQA39_LY13262 [Lamprigera yunnana]
MRDIKMHVIAFILISLFIPNFKCAVPKPRWNSIQQPKTIIPDYYVKEVRPPTYKHKPVEIKFNMKVLDINSINVEDMDFRLDMLLKQEWTDPRLRIPEEMFEIGEDACALPAQLFENLWQPDLYFLNSKIIVAYKYDKMILKWGDARVSISPELKLLQYHIGQSLELKEMNIFTSEKGGNYSRLVVYFRFERQIGHHLIQTFAPSTLIVMLSWFSFWLELDAVPARVTLVVTCMLTLVTMFTGLRSDIPPVAYIKALDLWMAFCIFLVFATLTEFVIVKVLHKNYQKQKQFTNSSETLEIAQWCQCKKTDQDDLKKQKWIPLGWTNVRSRKREDDVAGNRLYGENHFSNHIYYIYSNFLADTFFLQITI